MMLASLAFRFRASVALATVAVGLLGAGCSTVSLDTSNVHGRAFAAPAKKPRLLLAPILLPDSSWKDASIYWTTVDPDFPNQIRATIKQAAMGTGLFKEIKDVDFDLGSLAANKSRCEPDDYYLAATMPKLHVDGGPSVATFVLFFFSWLSLLGVPAAMYHDECEWRLQYRLVEVGTMTTKIIWDSDPISTNDATFLASWSNSANQVGEMFDRQGRRLFTSFAGSFAPLATGKQIEVDYPYEAGTPRVDIRVSISDDPSLQIIDVDVNEQRVAQHDRTLDARNNFPLSINLNKGSNVVTLLARDKSGTPVSRVDITITRLK